MSDSTSSVCDICGASRPGGRYSGDSPRWAHLSVDVPDMADRFTKGVQFDICRACWAKEDNLALIEVFQKIHNQEQLAAEKRKEEWEVAEQKAWERRAKAAGLKLPDKERL